MQNPLWDDIFSFAIPDEGRTDFDSNSEYFLGPIVTFKNDDNKMEIIDGQQRFTTLMLLLRAFYSKFGHMQDKASVSMALPLYHKSLRTFSPLRYMGKLNSIDFSICFDSAFGYICISFIKKETRLFFSSLLIIS